MDIVLLDGSVLVSIELSEDRNSVTKLTIPGMAYDEEHDEWVEVPLPEPERETKTDI